MQTSVGCVASGRSLPPGIAWDGEDAGWRCGTTDVQGQPHSADERAPQNLPRLRGLQPTMEVGWWLRL